MVNTVQNVVTGLVKQQSETVVVNEYRAIHTQMIVSDALEKSAGSNLELGQNCLIIGECKEIQEGIKNGDYLKHVLNTGIVAIFLVEAGPASCSFSELKLQRESVATYISSLKTSNKSMKNCSDSGVKEP